MPFTPQIPDKAGRGRLCAEIDALAKDLRREKDRGDAHECRRILARLDTARKQFHKLYGFSPNPGQATK